jgi:hypothetical protein
VIVAGVLTVAQIGCDDTKPPPPTAPTSPNSGTPPASATITAVIIGNVPTQPLDLGDHATLRADATLSTGQSRDCTRDAAWTTSDAKVMTVDRGTVTVVGAGSARVTATCDGKSGSAAIPIQVHTQRAVQGVVTDGASNTPVAGAFVRLITDGREGLEVTTATNGTFSFDIASTATTLAVDVRAAGYAMLHQPFDLPPGRPSMLSVPLRRAPSLVLARQGKICYDKVTDTPQQQEANRQECASLGYNEPSTIRWHVGRVYSGQFVLDFGTRYIDFTDVHEFTFANLICNGRSIPMTRGQGTNGDPKSWSAGMRTSVYQFTAPSDSTCDYDLEAQVILLFPPLYTPYDVQLTLQP